MSKMVDFRSKLQLNQLPLVIDEVEYLGLWAVAAARERERDVGLGVIILIRHTGALIAMRSNSCWIMVIFTIMVRMTEPFGMVYCNVK